MKLLACSLSLVLLACGGSSTPAPVPATPPQPKPATLPEGEVKSCGDACERKGACWQLSYGEAMGADEVAACEGACLTMPPDEGDAYMERISDETDCLVILEM
ncbi:MAG: hypothetical protein R2939_22280 [Kofleriaceae bacterium]